MGRMILTLLTALVITQTALAEIRYSNGEERLSLPHELSRPKLSPYSPQEQEEKQLEAISLYMILMREENNNPWAPFQLAITFAQKGRNDLALRYLSLSSQRGLWYYYNLLENNAFDQIRGSDTYQQVLSETKARYLQQAIGNEGKPFYTLPQGAPPPQGWPVIVYLHDFGESANITKQERSFYHQLGCVYIELNATQMLSEDTYRWSKISELTTHQAIQRAILSRKNVDKLDSTQVYLLGQGQGSLQAANLLANYPQHYAGGLLISPKGANIPAATSQANDKRIFISYLEQEDSEVSVNADYYLSLFTPHNRVKLQTYKDNDDTYAKWKTRYTQPLLWLLGKPEKT